MGMCSKNCPQCDVLVATHIIFQEGSQDAGLYNRIRYEDIVSLYNMISDDIDKSPRLMAVILCVDGVDIAINCIQKAEREISSDCELF